MMGRVTHESFAPSGVVSFLTDFGLRDPYVGQMHAVALACDPGLRLVDLCHHAPPQDVGVASFWLERCLRFFAPGVVHVVVVDPGVGSERRAILAQARGQVFVAPDNGVLSRVIDGQSACWEIDAGRLGIDVASRTFHGRDLFTPVAARIAAGLLRPDAVGPSVAPMAAASHVAAPTRDGDDVVGRVLFVDHFGNLVTNLESAQIAQAQSVRVGNTTISIRGTYADAAEGELVALVSSMGTLEIAVRNGSAAARLGVGAGDEVRATLLDAGDEVRAKRD